MNSFAEAAQRLAEIAADTAKRPPWTDDDWLSRGNAIVKFPDGYTVYLSPGVQDGLLQSLR